MILKKVIIVLTTFLVSSCVVRSVYVPTAHNVLLFDSGRQIQAAAYLGINTYQFQLACNPVNHLAAGLTNCYGPGLAIYEGYLGLYNYSKKTAAWRYELLAGGGYTNNYSQVVHGIFAALQNRNSNFETISAYNRVFVQPTFGFFSKINIYKLDYSFSFGNRFSFLNFERYIYREIDVDKSPIGGPTTYVVDKEYYNKNIFLLEPCITNKFGRNNVSAILQIIGILPYSNQIDVRYTKFSPGILLSLGFQYKFVFKKKATPQQ